MARKVGGSKPQQFAPVVNIAPLGELNTYTVYEHKLDESLSGNCFPDFPGIFEGNRLLRLIGS
jgi:hypothetical protein